MLRCPKCNRKVRVKTSLKKVKDRKFWVNTCVKCGTPIDMEEKEK